MWKSRREVAHEIAEVLSEHLKPSVRVIGIGLHGKTMEEEAKAVLKTAVQGDAETALMVMDGIGELEEIAPSIKEWREKGIKRIVVGMGVMPSHLVEPVKKLVEELFVLKIPRLFQKVGQHFEGVE